MIRKYEVITFDCYGTLIDWNRGIGNAFQAAACAEGIAVTLEHVLAIYHEIEPQSLHGIASGTGLPERVYMVT